MTDGQLNVLRVAADIYNKFRVYERATRKVGERIMEDIKCEQCG